MILEDTLKVLRAYTLLLKGIDYTKISYDSFKSYSVDNVQFVIDDFTKTKLGLFNNNIVATGRAFNYSNSDEEFNPIGTMTEDIFKDILYSLKMCKFSELVDVPISLYDKDYIEKLKAIDASWDYSKALDCPIKNELTTEATDKEFKILVALSQYPTEIAKGLYEAYKTPQEFKLERFKDFEVTDNRIIIPLSEADKEKYKEFCNGGDILDAKAIVISKNPLDYFYCSYGNAFQSCFALNSEYAYWYGYVPFAMAPESFIVYVTNGKVNKLSFIKGSKFHIPQMHWRAWGYACEDGNLVLDKKYRKPTTATKNCIEFFCNFMADKFNVHCDYRTGAPERTLFNKGKGIGKIWSKFKLSFFSDSIMKNRNIVSFQYNRGVSHVSTEGKPRWKKTYRSLKDFADTVLSVDDNLDISLPIIVDSAGMLKNFKLCPVSGLPISSTESIHKLSKYFTRPSTNTLALTYIDGAVLLDFCKSEYDSASGEKIKLFPRRDFCDNILYVSSICAGCNVNLPKLSLSSFKEMLKGDINNLPFDAVLLRIIEDDKVTYQVFKRKES